MHAGSGLGRAIAKGFVEANGGRRVESIPGQGSAFVVELPMTPEAAMTAGPAASSRRILAVDDELQILRALKLVLGLA